MVDKIKIETPRDSIITHKTANGTVTARLIFNPDFGSRISENFNMAQVFVDSEVLRLSEPYIPRMTGTLILSGDLGTDIGSGEVIYNAPYARQQYYSNKGQGMRGALWFERMKADRLEDIKKGAETIAGGNAK